jgi:hypothetical protein
MKKSANNYQNFKNLTLVTSFLLATELTLNANPARAVFDIDLTFISGTSTEAQQGFQQAAQYWESQFSDDMTVNLLVGTSNLGNNGPLASANYTELPNLTYSNIKTALTSDASSTNDNTAVSNLQSGSALTFYIDSATSETGTDPLYTNLNITTANAKSLGFSSSFGSSCDETHSDSNLICDANITFNSALTYDFNQIDGITSGSYDFVGTAIHEIGHSLGFTSGVDIVDTFEVPTTDTAVASVLDLFRYGTGNNGTLMDLRTGGSPFFSINGGTTSLGTFSTGVDNGDGEQASHWKDSLGLGIMDSTLARGELGVVTALDLQAFDVIGYNVSAAVPFEFSPSFGIVFVSGLFGMKKTTDALKRRKAIKN